MSNPILSTMVAAQMSPAELREFALTAPRQLAIFCNRYAQAKDARDMGDQKRAGEYLQAAKAAYALALTDSERQEAEAARTASIVAAKGMAQTGVDSAGGKNVVKIRAERKAATWLPAWTGNR